MTIRIETSFASVVGCVAIIRSIIAFALFWLATDLSTLATNLLVLVIWRMAIDLL